jgi:hypothetical protein
MLVLLVEESCKDGPRGIMYIPSFMTYKSCWRERGYKSNRVISEAYFFCQTGKQTVHVLLWQQFQQFMINEMLLY